MKSPISALFGVAVFLLAVSVVAAQTELSIGSVHFDQTVSSEPKHYTIKVTEEMTKTPYIIVSTFLQNYTFPENKEVTIRSFPIRVFASVNTVPDAKNFQYQIATNSFYPVEVWITKFALDDVVNVVVERVNTITNDTVSFGLNPEIPIVVNTSSPVSSFDIEGAAFTKKFFSVPSGHSHNWYVHVDRCDFSNDDLLKTYTRYYPKAPNANSWVDAFIGANYTVEEECVDSYKIAEVEADDNKKNRESVTCPRSTLFVNSAVPDFFVQVFTLGTKHAVKAQAPSRITFYANVKPKNLPLFPFHHVRVDNHLLVTAETPNVNQTFTFVADHKFLPALSSAKKEEYEKYHLLNSVCFIKKHEATLKVVEDKEAFKVDRASPSTWIFFLNKYFNGKIYDVASFNVVSQPTKEGYPTIAFVAAIPDKKAINLSSDAWPIDAVYICIISLGLTVVFALAALLFYTRWRKQVNAYQLLE